MAETPEQKLARELKAAALRKTQKLDKKKALAKIKKRTGKK